MWGFDNDLKTCLHKRKWKGEGFFILFSELAFSLIESILSKKVISFLSYFCKRYKKKKKDCINRVGKTSSFCTEIKHSILKIYFLYNPLLLRFLYIFLYNPLLLSFLLSIQLKKNPQKNNIGKVEW